MTDVLRLVAHHPADHPYVRHLAAPDADTRPEASPSVWNVDRLRGEGIKVVHLHFGFEHLPPAELARWVDAIDAAGIALVHTVHDLDNPHLTDQRSYHRSIAILVGAASVVLTLTPAAAAMIEQRYRRRAVTVPHPHIVPLDRLERSDRHDTPPRQGVYVHAATLRPNFDVELVEALAEAANPVGGLRVHVRDSASPQLRHRLERLGQRLASVTVEPRLDDDTLWDRIASVRLLVLPYRWGTHSGLIEAGRDLGTPTLAPGFGGYEDQGAVRLDRNRLAECVRRAIASPPTVTAAGRRRQRHEAVSIHRRIYEHACQGRP